MTKENKEKFEVGDFVRWNNKKTFKITNIDTSWDESEELMLFDGTWDYRYDEPHGYYADECELWQPKEGELCWFRYNKGYPVVRPYNSILRQNYDDSLKNNHNPIIEPFIGELPSFIKDK